MEIVSALQCTSVRRLHKTWKALGKKEYATFITLSEVFSSLQNYNNYRRQIQQTTNEPIIPYIGVHLQDFLMVEELPTFLNDNMVNMRKMRRFTGLLKDDILSKQAEAKKYNFEVDPPLHDFLIKIKPQNENDLLKSSHVCEPSQLA